MEGEQKKKKGRDHNSAGFLSASLRLGSLGKLMLHFGDVGLRNLSKLKYSH
jgi:hypothetical protein